jgi:hypothetical protein
MMAAMTAAEALGGQDDYCQAYIQAFRLGKLELQREDHAAGYARFYKTTHGMGV